MANPLRNGPHYSRIFPASVHDLLPKQGALVRVAPGLFRPPQEKATEAEWRLCNSLTSLITGEFKGGERLVARLGGTSDAHIVHFWGKAAICD